MSREFKNKKSEAEKDAGPELIEKVVHINRCAKVVKGGRRFTFSALVVLGDGAGKIGLGYGKAKEVPDAIKKASDRARKCMKTISLKDTTIPHEVVGEFDGGIVMLRPASLGTGVIAGGGVRACLKQLASRTFSANRLARTTIWLWSMRLSMPSIASARLKLSIP